MHVPFLSIFCPWPISRKHDVLLKFTKLRAKRTFFAYRKGWGGGPKEAGLRGAGIPLMHFSGKGGPDPSCKNMQHAMCFANNVKNTLWFAYVCSYWGVWGAGKALCLGHTQFKGCTTGQVH